MKLTERGQKTGYRIALGATFVVCVVVIVLFSVPDLIPVPDQKTASLLSDALPRLSVGIFLFLLLFGTDEGGCLVPVKKGIGRAFLWCIPCFAVALANFPYSALASGKAILDRIDLLPLFLLKCFSVALIEELFFRALLVPFVRERIKGRLAVGWTVLVTAAIFALSHLFNLFFGASVGGTFLQVGYTFLLGCMFAVMLLKTGNVWLCVLVHFLFDVGGVLVTDLGHGPFQDVLFWILTILTGAVCCVHIVITLFGLIKGNQKEN